MDFMSEIDSRFKTETGITERRYYKIYYSHVHAFPLLVLGQNPGGETDGTDLVASTGYFENYEHDFACFRSNSQYSLARPMCELLSKTLDTDLVSDIRHIPVTNVIFRRSRNTSALNVSPAKAAVESAPFLAEIVKVVNPRVILLISKTAYDLFIKNHCANIEEYASKSIYTPNGKNNARIYLESSARVEALEKKIPLAMVGHPSKYSGRSEWQSVLKSLRNFFIENEISPISQVGELGPLPEIPSYGTTL